MTNTIVITFDSLVLSKLNRISLAFDLISVSFLIFEFFSFPVPFFLTESLKILTIHYKSGSDGLWKVNLNWIISVSWTNLNHPYQIRFSLLLIQKIDLISVSWMILSSSAAFHHKINPDRSFTNTVITNAIHPKTVKYVPKGN